MRGDRFTRVITARDIPYSEASTFGFTGPGFPGSAERMTARIFAAIACVTISIHLVQAQQYVEVTAEMETLSYKLGEDLRQGTNPIRSRYSLVCTIGTNDWRIDTSRADHNGQWWFDGTNLYENLATTSHSSVHVRSSNDGHPCGDLNVNLPWLAFCSGTYLKRPNRLIPFPLTNCRHAPDWFAYTDKTVTFGDTLGLPRYVDLYASDKLFDASVTNGVFRGKRDPSTWRRGSTGFKWDLPDGALRFHYAVTESTNFQGWNIPLKSEWTFSVHEDGQLFTRDGGSAKVTAIRVSGKPKSVIVLGASNQNIVDWRFRDPVSGAEAIIYDATSTHVAATNDPALQKTVQRTNCARAPQAKVTSSR